MMLWTAPRWALRFEVRSSSGMKSKCVPLAFQQIIHLRYNEPFDVSLDNCCSFSSLNIFYCSLTYNAFIASSTFTIVPFSSPYSFSIFGVVWILLQRFLPPDGFSHLDMFCLFDLLTSMLVLICFAFTLDFLPLFCFFYRLLTSFVLSFFLSSL